MEPITVGMLVDVLAFEQWSLALGTVRKLLTSPTGEPIALVRSGDGEAHWVALTKLRPTAYAVKADVPHGWR